MKDTTDPKSAVPTKSDAKASVAAAKPPVKKPAAKPAVKAVAPRAVKIPVVPLSLSAQEQVERATHRASVFAGKNQRAGRE